MKTLLTLFIFFISIITFSQEEKSLLLNLPIIQYSQEDSTKVGYNFYNIPYENEYLLFSKIDSLISLTYGKSSLSMKLFYNRGYDVFHREFLEVTKVKIYDKTIKTIKIKIRKTSYIEAERVYDEMDLYINNKKVKLIKFIEIN